MLDVIKADSIKCTGNNSTEILGSILIRIRPADGKTKLCCSTHFSRGAHRGLHLNCGAQVNSTAMLTNGYTGIQILLYMLGRDSTSWTQCLNIFLVVGLPDHFLIVMLEKWKLLVAVVNTEELPGTNDTATRGRSNSQGLHLQGR